MYVLEYKQLYIPRESVTKNRSFQGYRWKQHAICAEPKPLAEYIARQKNPENWRVLPLADSADIK